MKSHLRWRMNCAPIMTVIIIAYGTPLVSAGNFWQSLNGPQGGSMYALARDPATNDLYAATGYQHGYNKNAGSLFKSTDNGDYWTYVSADLFTFADPTTTRVRTLAVNATGHVFAGMDGAGIWRSTNGGTNWSAFNTGLGDLNVRAIGVAPTGETYAATETAGVHQLNGETWSAFNTNLTNTNTRCLAFGAGYMLVGTATGGIFKRPTGGSWSAANTGLTNLGLNGLYVSPNGDRVLAFTNIGLFESTDDAASWHELVGPYTGNLIWSATEIGGGILLASNIGLHLSDASGTQWTTATTGFTGTVCRVLMEDGNGRVFAGSFEEGLFRSTDGAQSWQPVNDGIYGHTVTRLLVTSTGTILSGTWINGVYRSSVLGGGWSGPTLPLRRIFALAQSPWGDLFAGNYNIIQPGSIPDGHAWRSSDDGVNWTPLDNGIIASMVSGFVFPAPQQVTCSIAWGTASVRLSATNGDAWTPLSPAPGIEAYCLARNAQGDLFIGSEGSGVHRYNAAAHTWTNLGLATISQQFSIAINSQGHVFVGNDGHTKGVHKSTANGDGLSPLNNFPSSWGYAILCLPNDDLYVGTRDAGIQYSNDGGASWTTVNSGIPVSACQALTLGPDGYLYAGVAGFGVYRSAQQVVSTLPGDIDGDGDVDTTDISLFVSVLLGAEQMPISILRSDVNSDSRADGADVASMISAYLNS
ncbi:MAG: dockerin type I domain-containing protein [Planctomycetota bacterium]